MINYRIQKQYKGNSQGCTMDKNSNTKLSLTSQHLQILEYTDSLFTRWSLRRNPYLSKHLKPTLEIPLFILAEQRRISQITHSQSTIIQALKLSEFIEVDPETRTVKLLELPTIRVMDENAILKAEKIVKEWIKERAKEDRIGVVKPLEYVVSGRTEDGFYYLTVKYRDRGEDGRIKNILKDILDEHGKKTGQKVAYSQQPMYQDIKQSISRHRKNKPYPSHKAPKEDPIQIPNPVYSRQNMMMMYPGMYYPVYGNVSMTGMMPEQVQMYLHGGMGAGKAYGVFIRKAVDSDDEDHQGEQGQAEGQNQEEPKKVEDGVAKEQNVKVEQKIQEQQMANVTQGHGQKKYESKTSPASKPKQKKPGKEKPSSQNKVAFNDQDFPTIG